MTYQWRGDTPTNRRKRRTADAQWAHDQRSRAQRRRQRRQREEGRAA